MASKRKSEDGKMIQAFSKINLIDLAGSEDNRRTGNAHGSAVFKESTKINLSLTVLKVSSNQNIDQGSMEQTGSVRKKRSGPENVVKSRTQLENFEPIWTGRSPWRSVDP